MTAATEVAALLVEGSGQVDSAAGAEVRVACLAGPTQVVATA